MFSPMIRRTKISRKDRCNFPVLEYSHQIPIPSKPPEGCERRTDLSLRVKDPQISKLT